MDLALSAVGKFFALFSMLVTATYGFAAGSFPQTVGASFPQGVVD
jgi:hypothetical protein